MSTALTDDFRSIVLENKPLLDVRAPVEFAKGAFPHATNLPILEDEERRLVGIEYKEKGNSAAIKLAETLIQQEGKAQRVQKWREYLQANPYALLYCFRGGQRSGIAQAWLEEAGIEIRRLRGGYKAFRNFLMEESLRMSAETKTFILGGRTGSGKTLLLPEIENSIDLEGLANHRGSSFGNSLTPQPSQIDFENALAYALIAFEAKEYASLVLEHESHNIGRTFMPKPIYENFMDGELILLETALEERIDISYEEYITLSRREYQNIYQERGISIWAEDVLHNLGKIKKRLGNERYEQMKSLFEEAFERESQELYREFIGELLVHYYDPMYDYQIETTKIPIVFRGDREAVIAFLKDKK